MKKLIIPFLSALFLILSVGTTGQTPPTLTFKMDNPRIIRGTPGPNTRFQFDVYVKASEAGTYLRLTNLSFSVASSANFLLTANSLKCDISGGILSGGSYIVPGGIKWDQTFSSFGVGINLDLINLADYNVEDVCAEIPTSFQKIATIGVGISGGGVAGTAGITFNPDGMPAGLLQVQQYALAGEVIPPPHHYYSAPNLFEGRNFSDIYLGRIFSTAWGWSQNRKSLPSVVKWDTIVNTSVWGDTTGTNGVASITGASDHLALALRVHSGSRLKIMPTSWLTCSGNTEINEPQGLRILSDATGTGSFIDNGTITYNTGGTARVERYFPNDNHWHYWSMPVTTSNAVPFIGLFMRFFDEKSYTFKQIIGVDTVLHPTFGYSVAANGINATVGVTGFLNTGFLTTTPPLTSTWVDPFPVVPPIPAGYDGWNFVGNPYPSSTDWELWSRTNVDPTMYCWNGAGYEVWPAYTGYGTKADKYLRPEQGFFVHVSTNGGTGSLSVNNASRTHQSGVYNKSTGINDKLVLTASANGIDDVALVAFNSNATLNFDPDYDAYKLMGISHSPNLYSLLPSDIIAAVNCLPWTSPSQVVPMGFYCGLSGAYHITASNLESFNSTTEIYIEDLKENITQDLIADPVYRFNYTKGEETNRFLLHFSNTTLGVNDTQGSKIQIYAYNDIVYVKHLSSGDIHGTVLIYDITGQKVFNGKLENLLLNKFRLTVTTGFYVVKVQTGQVFVTGKVFLNQK